MRHSLVVNRKLIWYEWELESKDWLFERLGGSWITKQLVGRDPLFPPNNGSHLNGVSRFNYPLKNYLENS